MTKETNDRYGKIVHAVFLPLCMVPSTPWDEISETQRQAYREIARAVIAAWQQDHATTDPHRHARDIELADRIADAAREGGEG